MARPSAARSRLVARVVVAVVIVGVVALATMALVGGGDGEAPDVAAVGGTAATRSAVAAAPDEGTAAPEPTSSSATPSSTTAPPTGPATIVVPREVDAAEWPGVVEALAPVQLPSDCPLPLDEAISLPNSPRDYRGGVHQGIDFICLERGRDAVAALPGRVVMANDAFVDPAPADRDEILGVAQALGRTPPWTLAMLYGRFVVLDHGVVPGVGHVVTVYAHLEAIDDAIAPGAAVEAGKRLGEIGNRGTDPAATGADDPRSLHLHWEILVDDVYLGAGADPSTTRQLYADLFGLG